MQIQNFHAHVYFSEGEEATQAHAFKELVARNIGSQVEIGRWHDKPVGPHPRGSYQILFGHEHVDTVLSFLMQYRNGLTIFVHGNSGNDYADHTDHVAWLGESETLKLDIFKG